MKLALYVEGSISQFVLTPETDWEKKTLGDLSDRLVNYDFFRDRSKSIPARIMRGGFYECQGGWVREGTVDNSLIVRFDTEEKKEETPISIEAIDELGVAFHQSESGR